jgi:hypothetical protein
LTGFGDRSSCWEDPHAAQHYSTYRYRRSRYADRVRFPCPAGSGEAPPPERQPLTAGELRAELAGHTFYRGPVNVYFAGNGVLYGTYKADSDLGTQRDVGRWHLTPEGQFCRQWHPWDGRRERCSAVSPEGETFVFSAKDRFETWVYRRVPGNPEDY